MRRLSILSLLLTLCATASAQTSLQAWHGWGGKERAGRWNPVFVRVSDATPRNVTLQFLFPTDGGFAGIIEENIAIGPTAATFELIAPSHYRAWQRSVIVLRDVGTGKFIAQFPQRLGNSTPDLAQVGPQQLFIGITGRRATMVPTIEYLGGQDGYLSQPQIPRSSIGFDCLDILLLNQPDLREIDRDQQQAILDWTRAGGNVLMVPGDDPTPRDSILAAALPARVAGVMQFNVTPQALDESGLLPRFERLSGHQLNPIEGADRVELIKGSSIEAVSARYGLGRMMVAPIDLTALEFDQTREQQATRSFWGPIIQTLVKPPESVDRQKYTSPYFGRESETPEQQREGAATATVCDFLAPAPSDGRSWRRWGLMLLGVLLVIGPIDSLVLKMTGRRARTWSTIPGWMGFLALAVAMSGARMTKTNTVVRSVRVIDQIDNQCVATLDLIGVQSSSEGSLDLTGADGWWEPVLPGNIGPTAVNAQPDARFHQTDGACRPESIPLSGETRFLRSQSQQARPPVLRASLLLAPSAAGGGAQLVGVIRNVSDLTLEDLRVRTSSGVISIPLAPALRLGPGQEVKVNVSTDRAEAFSRWGLESRHQSYGFFGSRTYSTPISDQDLWAVAPDLSGRRTMRIDELLETDNRLACIYARVVNPPAVVRGAGIIPPTSQYYQWIRALVPLER